MLTVEREDTGAVPDVLLTEREGVVNADLTVGASPESTKELDASSDLAHRGVNVFGKGFIVTLGTANLLGLGQIPGLENHIKPYVNGRDVSQRSRNVYIIDFFGLEEHQARQDYPAAFQHLLLHVKPERDQNARESIRNIWWQFGWPRPELRRATFGLSRYIVTVETTKHRIFGFLDAATLPDNKLICIASDNPYHLGVLSSRIHTDWALAAGGWLGFGNDPVYVKTKCFDPFPFPAATQPQAAEIAALAEELDALRKARLAAYPYLTLTGLYNVLAAIRAGQPLTDADRDTLDAGHVEVLRHLHDRLDAAVAAAYGWPADLPAAAIVERVVALNRERAAEEAAGQVRWLRPAYQAPAEMAQAARKEQLAMAMDAGAALPAWPKAVGAQYVALRATLARIGRAGPADLARQFRGVRAAKLAPMLEALAAMGQAREAGGGRYVA